MNENPCHTACGCSETVLALLTGPGGAAPGVLGQVLQRVAQGVDLPWPQLLTPQDWTRLDPVDLTAFVLTPPARLSPSGQSLQAAALAGLAAAGWQLRDSPRPWLRPADPAWWERLLDLLAQAPALLPTELLADVGRGLSPDELPSAALAPLLAAELAVGTLWRRRFQTAALAAAAALPGVLPVLVAATEAGVLTADWTGPLLADTDPRQRLAVGAAALDHWPPTGPWAALLVALLPGLTASARARPELIPPGLPAAVAEALGRLQLPRDLSLFRDLLGLRASLPVTDQVPLPAACWAALAALTEPQDQQCVQALLLAGQTPGLTLADCADPAGDLRLPWLGQTAPGAVLTDAGLLARLNPETLARLAATAPDAAAPAFAALDDWLPRAPERTAAALIRQGLWLPWRARARPWPAARRTLALLWLGHPAHREAPQPPSWETWRAVVADLAEGLDAEDLRALTRPSIRWPWLPGQSAAQGADLAAACRDLAALAELVEGLAADPIGATLPVAQLLRAWGRAPGLSAAAFAWLSPAHRLAATPPSLADSELLLAHAGERLSAALAARVAAVVQALDQDPGAALAAADRPRLWTRAAFRAAVGQRLSGPPPAWLPALEQHLAALEPADAAAVPVTTAWLAARGFPHTARWLASAPGHPSPERPAGGHR